MIGTKTTKDYFQDIVDGLHHAAKSLDGLNECVKQDTEEIKKLNSIIDELRDENEQLKRAAKGGEA